MMDRCPPMPGPASGLCGVTVGEYSVPHPLRPRELMWGGAAYPAPGFQETLQAGDGTEVIAYFSDHTAAMTHKPYTAGGAAYYVGCGFAETLAAALLRKLQADEPYRALVQCPPEVELCVRLKNDTRYLFLLNYTDREQTVQPQKPLHNLLSGAVQAEPAVLPPFGVLVLCDAL